jgi:hypothetical protein
MMAESQNSKARARHLLLSNDSEITFLLEHVAANELLPSNMLLNRRFHDNQEDNRGIVQCGVFYAGHLAVIKGNGFMNSRSTGEQQKSRGVVERLEIRDQGVNQLVKE